MILWRGDGVKSKILNDYDLQKAIDEWHWKSSVDEGAVQENIYQVGLKFKSYQPQEDVWEGDIVTVRMSGGTKKFNRTAKIRVGNNLFDKTLESAIVGKKVGEEYACSHPTGEIRYTVLDSSRLIVPFVLASGFVMGKMAFGIRDLVNRKSAEMARDVSEKVANEMLIKAASSEEKEVKNGLARMKDLYKTSIKASWIGNLASPVNTIVGMLRIVVIVLVGRSFYQNGSISLAQWIAYLAFAGQVANTLQAYSGYWSSFKASQGSTRRVTYIMDEINETLGSDKKADAIDGDFQFNDVSFAYGEKTVLDHISVTIPHGKVTAFVGMSGGGKTTMLNLMERFYTPREGTITVGGEDINSFNMKSYREQIAYITQESTLLSGTIRENILYGVNRKVQEEELDQVCRAAAAYDFIHEFPEGYDTQVGESGGKLSGGQKQRIAIARAMITNPKILLMDEATASLDYQSNKLVWEAAERLMQGRTTILIAHDMNAVTTADNIVVMNAGAIEATGTHETLMRMSPTYRDYVALQTKAGGNES